MEAANITFRLLASSQVFLFLLLIIGSSYPPRVRVIGATLMLATVAYLVEPLVLSYLGVERIVISNVFPSLIPILTLLFVWAIFEERNPIPAWIWVVLGIDIALSLWVSSLTEPDQRLQAGSQIVKTAMAVMAIYVVWRGWEDDLVEMRVRIRRWFISAFAATVLAVAVLEFFAIYEMAQPTVIWIAWMFCLSLLWNLSFLRLNPSAKLIGGPTNKIAVEQIDDPIILSLVERMQSERLYADHDLRVGSLAQMMAVPEYQLRKNINQSLGFRNFNQFINHYRIEEAGKRLLEDRRSPVLSIALDVGFRSISSFNSAFVQKFGVSPTVYRSQSLPNSLKIS